MFYQKEKIFVRYLVALIIMLVGTAFVVYDTLLRSHLHKHVHTFSHTHDGTTHTHQVVHTHLHNHFTSNAKLVIGIALTI